MKKIVNISLSLIYVLFTIGVAISSHYCMGKIGHQDVFSFDNHGCMCDDLLGDEDTCCDDELNIISIEEDQQVSAQLTSIVPKLIILFAFERNTFLKDESINVKTDIEYFENPPPKADQPLYLINCEYTFYG